MYEINNFLVQNYWWEFIVNYSIHKLYRNLNIKLIYNKEKLFCTKTEMLNFNITLPLIKLDLVSSTLVSNNLIFSENIPVDIQLVTSLLLSNIEEISIGAKTRKV